MGLAARTRLLLLLLLLATLEGSTDKGCWFPGTSVPLAFPATLTAFQAKLSGMVMRSGALSCFGLRSGSGGGAGVLSGLAPPFDEPEDSDARERRLKCSRVALAVLAQIADDREALESWESRQDEIPFEIRGVDTGGVRLPDSLTHDSVVHLVDQLYNHKQRLHSSALDRLLVQVSDLLREEPNLVRIPPGQRVTVVGDVHGSLADVQRIFQLAGWPGPGNTFIFNGDFVDRGDRGVEVIAVLFALKIVHPKNVILNRGNHEDYKICRVYGFWEEVMSKYGSRALYSRICDVFALLPLGCVIGEEALVVHAGLPRSLSVSLADIDAIPRKMLRSTVRAGWDGASGFGRLACGLPSPLGGFFEQSITIAEDLLWSDPLNPQDDDEGEGDMCLTPNHARGAGTKFGPGVARSMLGKLSRKSTCAAACGLTCECFVCVRLYAAESFDHVPYTSRQA
jgi:diadenosine tetraphosphatase ApaH/serine/threonine PP2A family protein phosphatase